MYTWQAIIVLADAVGTPLDVAFTDGGEPFLIQLSSDFYEADFVIATTAFDPDGSTSAGTRSPDQSRRQSSTALLQNRGGHRGSSTTPAADATPAGAPGRTASIPLFHPASQQEDGNGVGLEGGNGGEDEFDFGGEDFDMAALDAAEVAATQQLTQQQATQRSASQQQQEQQHGQVLVPDTSEARDSISGTGTGSGTGPRQVTRSTVEPVGEEGDEEEEEGGSDEAGPSYPRTQLGPTQPAEGRRSKKVSLVGMRRAGGCCLLTRDGGCRCSRGGTCYRRRTFELWRERGGLAFCMCALELVCCYQ